MSSRTAGAARITLAGELDLARAHEFEDALRVAEADDGLVVVDLRRLEFIDGAGLQPLVGADRRIRRSGGRLIVVRGGEMVHWFFGLVGVEDELELVDEPPNATRDGAHDRSIVSAPERDCGEARGTRAPVSSTVRRLNAMTAERDELLARVGALEQELLDLVGQAPAEIGADPLERGRPG